MADESPPHTANKENIAPVHHLHIRSSTGREIMLHFWPSTRPLALSMTPQQQDAAERSPLNPDRPSLPQRSTLNSSEAAPDRLAFVLLHQNANPLFESQGMLYAKTNIHLVKNMFDTPSITSGSDHPKAAISSAVDMLMGDIVNGDDADADDEDEGGVPLPIDPLVPLAIAPSPRSAGRAGSAAVTPLYDSTSRVDPDLIPVFDQIYADKIKTLDVFRFVGYYKLNHLAVHEPRTQSLSVMLDKKWTRTKRNGDEHHVGRDMRAWRQSYNYEWAEICLIKDDDHELIHGPPDIERLHDHGSMLAGLARPVDDMFKDLWLNGDNNATQ